MRMTTVVSIVIVVLVAGLATRADESSGLLAARAVEEGVPLVHTTQLVAPTPPPGATAEDHTLALLSVLEQNLREVKSDLGKVIRLNVYAANDEAAAQVREAVTRRFTGKMRPALSLVVGTPLAPNVPVSLDAVAISGVAGKKGTATWGGAKGESREASWAILPAGPSYYIAGQAERGKSIAESTRKTLASLDATLTFLGRSRKDVIQVKAFHHPMTEIGEVRKEIAAYFGKDGTPPVTILEWLAKDSIEIEMVVAGSATTSKATSAVEYLTPPGMTASPIYSRVARINHGKRIYTSGLVGAGKDGAAQVKDSFAQLQTILKQHGGDLKHLVKATYYVSTEDASKQLNVLRPGYYDPKRPPSASKASVRSTGTKASGLVMDMIAVVPAK